MNILILTNHMRPGGIPAYVIQVATFMQKKGHCVHVASGGGAWCSQLRDEGITHHMLPMDSSAEMNPGVLYSFLKLKEIILCHDIQVCHDQTRVTQFLSYLLHRSLGVKRLSTCHGYMRRRWVRRALPLWGEQVIAISPAVREHLLVDWGIPEDNIRLVKHGMTVANRAVDCAKARAAMRFAPNDFVVGAIGRFSPVKGYDIFLQAAAMAMPKVRQMRICLVGQGPEETRLRKIIKKTHFESRITVLKDIENRTDFFSTLDLFAAPSREEGLGLSIMEAMSHGVCVVASRVGGIRDLISHAESGWLVTPDSPADLAAAMVQLAYQKEMRARLGSRGRETLAQEFTVQKMADETEGAYFDVVNERGCGVT